MENPSYTDKNAPPPDQQQQNAPPPQYGQPGQPPQYGQPQYGQPQYGQPGQAPYGQPQYGQPGQPIPMQPMQGQPQYYPSPMQPAPGFAPGVPGGPQQQVTWMNRPTVAAGCPPGLEYLASIDQLVVKQQIELMELITSWECSNKYRVFNSVGQQVYFAQEESDMCMRQCCGPNRSFIIHITDNNGQEVLRVSREFKCCACGCCWCADIDGCSHHVTVEAPVGQVIGYVKHRKSGWKPKFTLYTADQEEIGHIEGPCCACNAPCCGDVNFPVLSKDHSTNIGNVAKQWTGALHEYFTDADTFSISFPMDMDVKMKGVMFGALFLIDFMYFEQSQNNNH